MPTADVYRTTASRLESARDAVASLMRPIDAAIDATPFPTGAAAGAGGNLERMVNTTLVVTSANVIEVATELRRQIAEARYRAAVCDRYAEAVRRYHHSTDPRRTFPPRPASWADHGW